MNPEQVNEPIVLGVQIIKDALGTPKSIVLKRDYTINEKNNEFLSALLSECLQNDFIFLKNPVHLKIHDKLKAMTELRKCGVTIVMKKEEKQPSQ